MRSRTASWICLAAAVACLGLAWWTYPRDTAVTAAEPELVGLTLPVGRHELRFALNNPGRLPLKFIGSGEC